MTDIHIPPEALQKAWETYIKQGCGPHAFEAACRAMLAAWPGAHKWDTGEVWHQAAIVLPLTENPDADA